MRRTRFVAALFAALCMSGAIPSAVAQIVTTSISAGAGHSCALTTGGGLKCWGYNFYGQLGVNSSGNWLLTPVDVNGLGSGVVAVDTGTNHTCALTTGGGVKCWGWNSYGQLGDGSTATRLEPVDVVGLTSGVAAISVGGDHTCAITEGGALKCWGSNFFGELGDNTITNRTSPIDVAGLASDVRMVSVGGTHTCALLRLGGVKCWGLNNMGHLGDGTNTQRRTPVDVVGLASGVESIDVGSYHSCAVAAGGALKCWGMNYEGELGNGTTTDSNTPVDVSGLASGVTAVSGGSNATCARLANAGLKCWGWNYYGEVGDGTASMRTAPVDVFGVTGAAISAGGNHTCALTTGGGVKCWGYNLGGQVGDGSQTETHLPVDVSGLAPSAPGIATQSIVFAAPAASAIDTPLELSATATSGLAVTFDSWTPSVCSVSGTTLTTFALGLCGVRASQAGNASFFPAPQQLRWISVGPPDQFLQIEKQGPGFGVVFGSGIDCGVTCYLTYPYGTVVTLNVVDLSPGSFFAGWSGAGCSGTGSCQVTLTDYTFVTATINVMIAEARDLSGDGMSDVLLRGPAGEVVAWLMNGDTISSSTLMLGGGTGYQATHFGDFNADAMMDLLISGPTGELIVWLMDGNVVTSSTLLLSGGSGYVVDKVGDFNGDYRTDILFKGAGGDLVVWLMSGNFPSGSAELQGTGTGFAPVAIGDFDNDGKADIVIAHPDGRITMWLMNGTTVASSVDLLGAGTGYAVSHVGDFNNNQKADLLLKGPAGEIVLWQMDGTTIANSFLLYGGGPWLVTHVADVNADGFDDMVLMGPAGEIVIWEMNGSTITGATLMYGGGPWQVTHVGDYNGDGKSDLLLKGPGGEIVVWVMNGSTITSATLLVGATTWTAMP